ncbi:hypothetical protein HOLleu_31635 [Holothuria leucospilota]|uniref:Uncharacterized protein n=1 Tax=Holothuria leucospilota TaxID=206669 RepID=A0A9Q1BIA2_HOLLE|nr:hypothetical protein HOLleu_31635 [Holothuria leucospilota]
MEARASEDKQGQARTSQGKRRQARASKGKGGQAWAGEGRRGQARASEGKRGQWQIFKGELQLPCPSSRYATIARNLSDVIEVRGNFIVIFFHLDIIINAFTKLNEGKGSEIKMRPHAQRTSN